MKKYITVLVLLFFAPTSYGLINLNMASPGELANFLKQNFKPKNSIQKYNYTAMANTIIGARPIKSINDLSNLKNLKDLDFDKLKQLTTLGSTSAIQGLPLSLDKFKVGETIYASDLNDLRTSLNTIRSICGLSQIAWSDSPLIAGQTPIKATHIVELRSALTGLKYTSKLKASTTEIKKSAEVKSAHITELIETINTAECVLQFVNPFAVQTLSSVDCKSLKCPASAPYLYAAPLSFIQGNDPYLCTVITSATGGYFRDGSNCSKKGASGYLTCSNVPSSGKDIINRSKIGGGARRFLNCVPPVSAAAKNYCKNPDASFCLNGGIGDITVY